MSDQKIFNQLLIFLSLYQHAKNEAVSSIRSGEKSCNLIGCKHFGLHPRNLSKNTVNNKNFYYRTNSVKINDQFVFKFKNPYFWLISPIFGAKRFSKKLGRHAQRHKGFQNHANSIPRKHLTDGRREGWTDPISEDPSSYCCGSTKYSCSRLAFKS